MSFRNFWLSIHRYGGLLMACFLVFEGLTGSVLAFRNDIDRLLSPQFFAKPQPGVAPLGPAALIDRAEALVPHGQVNHLFRRPDQIMVEFTPRINPATGKPWELGFAILYLDPWTGRELARLKPGDSINKFTDTIYNLHMSLSLKFSSTGMWVLGIVALIWTLDCFVGFYLTLPLAIARFWQRWKPAWLVKWRASAFRINFDLHRASGLWLWLVLLVFAWSSVRLSLPSVYDRVTGAIFDYRLPPADDFSGPSGREAVPPPRLDFRAALATGERLMAEQAASHGFSVRQQVCLEFDDPIRSYFYSVKSSRDILDRDHDAFTSVTFDADTGALRSLNLPTGERAGDTITMWLDVLHMAWVWGLPYRIFVCVLGFMIAMLSYTGIYIWWKKRQGRILAASLQRQARRIRPADGQFPESLSKGEV